jgi:hypothetical protein
MLESNVMPPNSFPLTGTDTSLKQSKHILELYSVILHNYFSTHLCGPHTSTIVHVVS